MHQLATSAVYVLMLYPVWIVRAWLPRPWGVIFVLTVLASVAAATSLRLHAWFTAQYFPADLAAQQAWTRDLKRWCDLVFASLLIVRRVRRSPSLIPSSPCCSSPSPRRPSWRR